MPAICECFTCGFKGNHGFSSKVAGIMWFYHSVDGDRKRTCGFYAAERQEYRTLKDAWMKIRERYPDDHWRQAYDALILRGDEREHRRLIDEWRKAGGYEPIYGDKRKRRTIK